MPSRQPAASADPPRCWLLPLPGGRSLELTAGRPRIMGVVNVTPDSFSDGGRWLDPERAIARALEMLAAGADLVDLGAESTRPGGGVYGGGARTVPAAEELARLLPVLAGLRRQTPAPLSIDTRKGAVARATLDAGADLINDVSALADPELGAAVAAAGGPLVLMHSRGELATMQAQPRYDDLLAEVRADLAAAVGRARQAGIQSDRLILDPGIGFGKTWRHNLELLRHLDRLAELGRPLLVGASRKSFIGHLTGAPPERRLGGSLAAVAWAALQGAALVRVHDVEETAQLLAVWQAIAATAAIAGGDSSAPAAPAPPRASEVTP